ncbi:MAG TPA: sulfite exporter TauE/SafE family protein [Armatimonadota bacterium]|nr:sulfite exporter TauE/SafE family protein [Armatimonadota bacterium]
MHLELWQWIFGIGAALLVGISKTGVPGVGILVVPLLASTFGGRQSVGIMLPMLIMGDVFAVAWYRRHAQWDKLVGLLPWVVVGLGIGAYALWAFGESNSKKDVMNIVIGSLVMVMLALYFVQRILGDRITPKSRVGVASTGVSAGFATTVSNAAGPIMTIFLSAHKLPKQQFMGTIAWYFFIINVSKMPVYFILTAMNPAKPIITGSSLVFNLEVFPAILVGVLFGKWLLPRMSQKAFDAAILGLAAVSALKLIIS